AGFGMPRFRAGIGRIHTYGHDFRNLKTPLAYDLKPAAIPGRISDEIDGDDDAKRSCEIKRFEILAQGNALTIQRQALFVDCLNAHKHIGEPQRLPKAEDVLVSQ